MTRPLPAAWRTVAMLSVLYAFSGIDRLILSLLVLPIKEELAVSDTQIGILFGLSFALLYTLAGLPIARIADHGNRKWVVVTGVIVWSASTALSAFSWDFRSLLLCRAGVAIGEAVLTPAAISMIADLFPREQRGKPTGIFVATGTVVGLSAALVGGAALALATWLSPFADNMAPWRLTLVLVGVPGILAALLFAAIVPEPARSQAAMISKSATDGHLRTHWLFYTTLFGAVGMSVALSYALIGFVPSMLVERFRLAPSSAGYVFGGVGVIFGLAGTLGTPWLAERLSRRTKRDGLLPVGIMMSLLALPAVVLAMFADNLLLFTGALCITLSMLPGLTMLPSLVVQQAAPPRQRGQMMALYLLIANMLGLGCGPMLAGLMSDTLYRDNGGMAMALATLGVGALSLTVILLLLARRPYRRLLAATPAS